MPVKPVCRLAALLALLFIGLQPARAELTEHDRRLYHDAFAAAKTGNWREAWSLANRARDPLPGIALRWADLTHGGTGASFGEIVEFMSAHPDWPGQGLLTQRAEDSLSGVSNASLAQWFAQHPPATPAGKLRQAELYMATGRQEAGYERIRDAWVDAEFSPFEEKSFLQRYKHVLRQQDHARRLDRLLWDDEVAPARRMLRLLSGEYRALAEARIGLAWMSPGVERLVARVPANLQRDPGFLFERMRWRRRKELYDGAVAILENAPHDLVRPAAWATERQILGRHLLADGKAALAYKLAANHGLSSGPVFSELEFLAGWIALRALHRPEQAYNHFVHLYDSVKLPVSLSRGAYWAARAAEAMNKRELAADWYGKAAAQITTYYGQLAAAHLGTAVPLDQLAEPVPSDADRTAFEQGELVQVARDLAEIGADDDYLKAFIKRVGETAQSPAQFVLTARLAAELGHADLAVGIAKRASYAGVTLLAEGYPMADLPTGGAAERPLILAMTRQESAFDREAVSRAGARGLMQLMPATAVRIARALQMPFSASRLTSDMHYNVTLGRAYLDSLLIDYSGSYVLAIAAYNAGPARVHDWIDDFGDPRKRGIDVIDWIESIPYTETRNYVQRVLENLQVYRLRLGDHNLAFSLVTDLQR